MVRVEYCPDLVFFVLGLVGIEAMICLYSENIHVHLWSCGPIHALETWWPKGVWLCIMPGPPAYLVQELNAETVYIRNLK